MKNNRIFWVFCALALLVLTACFPTATASPAPSLSPSPATIPTQLPTGTETARPSPTLTARSTLIPIPSATPVPSATSTATLTETPRPSFAGFQVEFVDYALSYGMQLAFIIPGNHQNYRLEVNAKQYTCNYIEKYPDRLFCSGPAIAPKTQIKLTFFPLEGEKIPVFSASYRIPALTTPTVDLETAKGFNPENCPVRGVDVHCETEYRVLGGGCCVVSTCVDACGYYYSVDTCPEGMEFQGECQGTPPVTPPSP